MKGISRKKALPKLFQAGQAVYTISGTTGHIQYPSGRQQPGGKTVSFEVQFIGKFVKRILKIQLVRHNSFHRRIHHAFSLWLFKLARDWFLTSVVSRSSSFLIFAYRITTI